MGLTVCIGCYLCEHVCSVAVRGYNRHSLRSRP